MSSPAENQPQEQQTETRFYTVNSIMLATFIGSALAGGILLAHNFRQNRDTDKARAAISYSLLALFLIMTVSFQFPEIPGPVYTLPQLLAMFFLTRKYFGQQLEDHKSSGGKFESAWKAFGISLLVIIAVVITMTLFVTVSGQLGIL